jgi:hypothetical protein
MTSSFQMLSNSLFIYHHLIRHYTVRDTMSKLLSELVTGWMYGVDEFYKKYRRKNPPFGNSPRRMPNISNVSAKRSVAVFSVNGFLLG